MKEFGNAGGIKKDTMNEGTCIEVRGFGPIPLFPKGTVPLFIIFCV